MTNLVHPARVQLRTHLRGLYVITDERAAGQTSTASHELIARAAIRGGAQILQLRAKNTPPAELIAIGRRLRTLTREAGVLLIANDQPELALEIDADGVHLGPEDLSPRDARGLLAETKLIGVSCGDEAEARAAHESGADYIGAGAIFATATKLDAGAPIGLEKLRAIIEATPLPVTAIGGIEGSNIASVAQSGAHMACVISAITREPTEEAMATATRILCEKFTFRT